MLARLGNFRYLCNREREKGRSLSHDRVSAHTKLTRCKDNTFAPQYQKTMKKNLNATNVASEKNVEKSVEKNVVNVENPQVKTDKEESELRKVRNCFIGFYARTAWDVFTKYVDLNESELSEFKRITNDATIVFTIPSDETLKANPDRFTLGRKFGSVQWYKKTQVVETALNILTSYSSFIRYMDSKENAVERDNKKLAAAAAVLGITVDELLKLKK